MGNQKDGPRDLAHELYGFLQDAAGDFGSGYAFQLTRAKTVTAFRQELRDLGLKKAANDKERSRRLFEQHSNKMNIREWLAEEFYDSEGFIQDMLGDRLHDLCGDDKELRNATVLELKKMMPHVSEKVWKELSD